MVKITSVVLALLASVQSFAETQTHSLWFWRQAVVHHSIPHVVHMPQFDPALGTLDSVHIEIAGEVWTQEIRWTTNGTAQINQSFHNHSGGDIVSRYFFSSFAVSLDVPAGVASESVQDGEQTVTTTSSSPAADFVVSGAAALSPFIGDDVWYFFISADVDYTAEVTGGQSSPYAYGVKRSGAITVTFNYTPTKAKPGPSSGN